MKPRVTLSRFFFHLAFWTVMAMSGQAVLPAQEARAAGGQCRWEGGSGAPTYPACKQEDCQGHGGTAHCTEPIPRSGTTDGAADKDGWTYNACIPNGHLIQHCTANGGTWNGSCNGLPPGFVGGSSKVTNSNPLATSAMDAMWGMLYAPNCSFSGASPDTGWGASLGLTACWGGTTQLSNGLSIRDVRVRTGQHACANGSTISSPIEMLRTRAMTCPPQSITRTRSDGMKECVRPAPPPPECCEPRKKHHEKGNPINLATGAKEQREVDYTPALPGSVRFERHYNSNAAYRMVRNLSKPRHRDDFWRHNYSGKLWGSNTPELLNIHQRADGSVQYFDSTGKEGHNHSGAADRLQVLPDGTWKLTRSNEDVEYYDGLGNLTSLVSRNGVTQTLTYTNGLLTAVVDSFGHQLSFGYAPSMVPNEYLLTSVTTPAGLIQFGFDLLERLVAVSYPDSTTRIYRYDDPNRFFLLTGIFDESGARYSTYGYDTEGRAISTEDAGDAAGLRDR